MTAGLAFFFFLITSFKTISPLSPLVFFFFFLTPLQLMYADEYDVRK